jgi:proliferating cell nuclear antigen
MDSSHVALVSLTLGAEGFDYFRADRAMTLGVSITNLAKVLKLAANEDILILRADDDASTMQIIFENASKLYITINMPIRIGEEN